jgi:hypothetical protein
MNTQHLRRRLAPYDYGWGDLVDNLDKVKLLIDPASTYARTGAMAMNRGQDDEIINAFFGTAYTGHSGGRLDLAERQLGRADPAARHGGHGERLDLRQRHRQLGPHHQ